MLVNLYLQPRSCRASVLADRGLCLPSYSKERWQQFLHRSDDGWKNRRLAVQLVGLLELFKHDFLVREHNLCNSWLSVLAVIEQQEWVRLGEIEISRTPNFLWGMLHGLLFGLFLYNMIGGVLEVTFFNSHRKVACVSSTTKISKERLCAKYPYSNFCVMWKSSAWVQLSSFNCTFSDIPFR